MPTELSQTNFPNIQPDGYEVDPVPEEAAVQQPQQNQDECIIPESGPWPECAKSGIRRGVDERPLSFRTAVFV